jgi:hypothetical protein
LNFVICINQILLAFRHLYQSQSISISLFALNIFFKHFVVWINRIILAFSYMYQSYHFTISSFVSATFFHRFVFGINNILFISVFISSFSWDQYVFVFVFVDVVFQHFVAWFNLIFKHCFIAMYKANYFTMSWFVSNTSVHF